MLLTLDLSLMMNHCKTYLMMITIMCNPLALVAQQQPVYHPQTHPTHYTQNSSTRSQQAATRNRGKAIVNSPQPIYDQEPYMDTEDEEISQDKEIDKLMILISLSSAGYENQRIGNVAGARETKRKRAKDVAYHREKMLLCKEEEVGIQLNAEQADWRDDTDDDKLEDQELEAHYMYMAQIQEVSPDAADSGPIIDDEPLQKVSSDDHYNLFAMKTEYCTGAQQAATRNRGKAIVNSPQPIYDQEPSMVVEDEETSQDKEIDKLMALISLSSAGYENQRIGNVAGARETVGSTVVQKSGIQCYNCKEYGHVARECQKPKRAKDEAYHREKMLLCKQEEVGIQLNAEQADWRDDTNDDESKDQELEAHYMYMAQLKEVSPDDADSGPIFDDEPLQKVSNDDHYNVFAIESEHPEQSESVHDT
nr:hypothetical protein [Tanacetum cinerariifolium]